MVYQATNIGYIEFSNDIKLTCIELPISPYDISQADRFIVSGEIVSPRYSDFNDVPTQDSVLSTNVPYRYSRGVICNFGVRTATITPAIYLSVGSNGNPPEESYPLYSLYTIIDSVIIPVICLYNGVYYSSSCEVYSDGYVLSFDLSESKPNAIISSFDIDNVLVRVGDPYSPAPSVTPGGGGGNFGSGTTSDTIEVPSGGAFASSASLGSFTRYLCSPNQVNLFFDWIWTNDWWTNFWQDLGSKIFGDASQSIISIMQFPFQVAGNGTMQSPDTTTVDFWWGRQNMGISTNRLDSEVLTIDWGEQTFTEGDRWFGNFLDYAPYTKADLYLPWGTGFVNLDVGEFYPGTIKVTTLVDTVSGSCVHNVDAKQPNDTGFHTVGTYKGQCGRLLAWNSDDWAAKVGKVTAAVATAAVAVGAGAAASAVGAAQMGAGTAALSKPFSAGAVTAIESGVASGRLAPGMLQTDLYAHSMSNYNAAVAMQQSGQGLMTSGVDIMKSKLPSAIQGINAASNTPNSYARSGSFSDGDAGLQPQYPYIIFNRPKFSKVDNYGHFFGFPSNIYAQLITLSGYTEIAECHWTNIGCTFAELKEIDSLMKAGVIL